MESEWRIALENAAKELPAGRYVHRQLDEGEEGRAAERSPDACRLRRSPITQEEVCN